MNNEELEHLRTCIAARMAMSVTLGYFAIAKDPENEYLKLHALPGRKALVEFWSKSKAEVNMKFREAY